MKIKGLKKEKIGICVSGGLDSKAVTKRLVEEGLEVVCFCADLGQPDEKDINDVKERMAPCGAETVIVDLRNEMAEACFEVIKGQATYDGGYWNSTGVARAVTVQGLLPAMQKERCTVLAHGATGRGNDQLRFERYTNLLAPEMKVYAPWRDPALLTQFAGRKEMSDYLNGFGIDVGSVEKKRYSTDCNLAGLSHEGGDLESVQTAATIVSPVMCVWPKDAPDAAEEVSVRFEKGRATEINGSKVGLLEAMLLANEVAGRNGVGLSNALENRMIGTKSRGVYEAPGMTLLGYCLAQLYQAVMARRATGLFEQLSSFVSNQIYDGRYLDLATTSAMAGIDVFAAFANGLVEVELYKGSILFHGSSECSGTLYREEDSSMEASSGLNPATSQGYAEIQSVEAKSMSKAGQIRR